MEREIAPSSAAQAASTFLLLTAIHPDRHHRFLVIPEKINKANTPKNRSSCIVPIPCASRALPQLPRFKTLPHHLRQRNRVGSLAKAASVSYNFVGTGSDQGAQKRPISLLRISACCRSCLLHPLTVAALPILPSRASRGRMGTD